MFCNDETLFVVFMRRPGEESIVICAFTGHRPQRLPWGNREEDSRCLALKQLLGTAIDSVVERGCRHLLCGMALGCDTYFAEAVVEKKKRVPDLILEAVLPCPGQADRWLAEECRRYEDLLLQCSCVTVLEDCYSEGCMLRRNRAMVERADILITVFDGKPGGTASTVSCARQAGVELLPVWL